MRWGRRDDGNLNRMRQSRSRARRYLVPRVLSRRCQTPAQCARNLHQASELHEIYVSLDIPRVEERSRALRLIRIRSTYGSGRTVVVLMLLWTANVRNYFSLSALLLYSLQPPYDIIPSYVLSPQNRPRQKRICQTVTRRGVERLISAKSIVPVNATAQRRVPFPDSPLVIV